MTHDQETLSTWTCDLCSGEITNPENGLLIWKESGGWDNGNPPIKADLLVVHKNLPDSLRRCDPGTENGYYESLELSAYLGDEGRAWLLSYLSLGPIHTIQIENPRPTITDFAQYVDLFHRFQTPWYEEARSYLHTAASAEVLGGIGPAAAYVPATLREIAMKNRRAD